MGKILIIITVVILSFWTKIIAQSSQTFVEGGNVFVPQTNYQRYVFPVFNVCCDTIDVYNESELRHGLAEGRVIVLQNDIRIKQTVEIMTDAVIIGNGHKIVEKGVKLDNHGSYLWKVNGREAFVRNDSLLVGLSNSGFYQGEWIVSSSVDGVCRQLRLPESLHDVVIKEEDNVFITYGQWFIRRTDKVKYAKDGVLEVDFIGGTAYRPDRSFRNYTPAPYFFFNNYSADGICIKSGVIEWPKEWGNIRKCQLWYLFKISPKAKVVMKDIVINGGMDYAINNAGELRMERCCLTNSVGGGIISTGKVSISNCALYDIKRNGLLVKKMGMADVSFCQFKRIAHYGSNDFAVSADGETYVGNCQFEDTNYGAIRVGMVNAADSSDLYEYLIENNNIYYTSDWITKRQYFGLWDSGAIYISTNSKKTTIRYNRIQNVGGPGKNSAIFGDDGAYNMDIFCNEISGTQNYYDIDCRYVSPSSSRRIFPDGSGEMMANTNNRIIGNVISGYVRMEESKSPFVNDTGCQFRDNVIMGDRKRHGNVELKDQIFIRKSGYIDLTK